MMFALWKTEDNRYNMNIFSFPRYWALSACWPPNFTLKSDFRDTLDISNIFLNWLNKKGVCLEKLHSLSSARSLLMLSGINGNRTYPSPDFQNSSISSFSLLFQHSFVLCLDSYMRSTKHSSRAEQIGRKQIGGWWFEKQSKMKIFISQVLSWLQHRQCKIKQDQIG